MIFVIAILSAIIGGGFARSRGKNVVLWAIICGIFPFALLYFALDYWLAKLQVVREHVAVGSKAELFGAVQTHAAQGYQTVLDRNHFIVMNKKVPFNWLSLGFPFVPLIGWLLLLVYLHLSRDKWHSVTIEFPENT